MGGGVSEGPVANASGTAPSATLTVPRSRAAASTPVARTNDSGSLRLVLKLALLLAPVVIVAAAAWSHRWIDDDGFINLRVVSELLHGHGPVFNPGERVEAVTSPLWIYVLALGHVILPVRLEWVTILEGLGFTTLGFGLVMFGSTRLQSEHLDSEWWIPAGGAVLAALAPVWTFGTSGLENGLTWAWLGACLLLLARWTTSGRRVDVGTAVVVGLGPLIRPEFAIFSAAFVVVALAGDRSGNWRSRLFVVGAALALPVAYEIFRMGFYGQLVPNSALAKSAAGSRWRIGWAYLMDTVRPYWLWIPLAVLAVGAYLPLARRWWGSHDLVDVRRRLVAAAFVIGGVVDVVYVVRLGGDYIHSRLLLPGLIAMLAPVAVVPLRRAYGAALLVLPWALVAGFGLRSNYEIFHYLYARNAHPVTLVDLGWDAHGPFMRRLAKPGVYMGYRRIGSAPPGYPKKVVAMSGVGVGSYAVGPNVYVLDVLGLGDALGSHLALKHRGLNSHEKPLPQSYVAALVTTPGQKISLSQFTEQINFGVVVLYQSTPSSFAGDVSAARHALQCSGLRRLIDDVRSPLTPGRFLSNLWHATPNTFLQLPPNPHVAEARYCGSHNRASP